MNIQRIACLTLLGLAACIGGGESTDEESSADYAGLRLVHVAAQPALSVTIEERATRLIGLEPGAATQHLAVRRGAVKLLVRAAGVDTPLIEATLQLTGGLEYAAVLHGGEAVTLTLLEERFEAAAEGSARARWLNLAAAPLTADVGDDGVSELVDLAPGEASPAEGADVPTGGAATRLRGGSAPSDDTLFTLPAVSAGDELLLIVDAELQLWVVRGVGQATRVRRDPAVVVVDAVAGSVLERAQRSRSGVLTFASAELAYGGLDAAASYLIVGTGAGAVQRLIIVRAAFADDPEGARVRVVHADPSATLIDAGVVTGDALAATPEVDDLPYGGASHAAGFVLPPSVQLELGVGASDGSALLARSGPGTLDAGQRLFLVTRPGETPSFITVDASAW